MAGLITAAQARAARGRETIVNQLYDAVKVKVDKGAASQIDLKLAEIETGRLARERVAADLAAVRIDRHPRRRSSASRLAPTSSLTTPLGGPKVHLPPQSQLLSDARAHRAELRGLRRGREPSWTPS